MKLSNSLLKLACVLPATLILAESLQACPFRRSAVVNERPHSVQVISSGNTYHYQLIPASTPSASQSQARPYGFVGVAIEPLTPERAEWLNEQQQGRFSFFNLFGSNRSLPEVEGVLVVRTLEQGPAAAAGLQEGDVLLGVHGRMVNSVREVQYLIGNTPVGHEVPVTFQRQNQVHTVTIATGDGRVLRPMMQQQLP